MSVETVMDTKQVLVSPDEECLVWWGVTVGSLVYAAFAPNAEIAKDLVFQQIGVPRKDNPIPVFCGPHGSEFQTPLTRGFGNSLRAIRVIPFSMDPWSLPTK